ncbi:hypothetical protein ACD661_06240 [Legionella lytica]|uniref:Uncharacterized protein n=1 Tax=Legionella lytica TaxID=96232 RepID=A0ABW8D632_9GAMM
MKKHKKEHPEVTDIKNICDITPNAPHTEEVCKEVKKQSNSKPKTKPNSKLKEH